MENNKTTSDKPWGLELNSFCQLMHLANLVFWPLSIIMWLTNKDNHEIIDTHGKNIANFLISYAIYFIVSSILMIVIIGIFTAIALGILSIVFIIMAAINAGKGEVYNYPLTIKIIKYLSYEVSFVWTLKVLKIFLVIACY